MELEIHVSVHPPGSRPAGRAISERRCYAWTTLHFGRTDDYFPEPAMSFRSKGWPTPFEAIREVCLMAAHFNFKCVHGMSVLPQFGCSDCGIDYIRTAEARGHPLPAYVLSHAVASPGAWFKTVTKGSHRRKVFRGLLEQIRRMHVTEQLNCRCNDEQPCAACMALALAGFPVDQINLIVGVALVCERCRNAQKHGAMRCGVEGCLVCGGTTDFSTQVVGQCLCCKAGAL